MNLEDLRKEVSFAAVASRGPGGQNVNKVATAALLTWSVESSSMITEEQKTLLLMKLRNRINNRGEIYLRSDEFRDLPRNKERGLQKLFDLVRGALHRPKPRKATRPTSASQRKRIDSKTRRSVTKQQRRRVDYT